MDALNDYISSDRYLNDDPGVCFGFNVEILGKDDYNVNLFFDDQD